MIEIFTDGSARNNQGGWGWVATFEQRKLSCDSGKINNTTHQAMEIYAVIKALESFSVCNIDITIFSDSMYVVNCINERWFDYWRLNGWMTKGGKEVKNIVYWERLLKVIKILKPTRVKFRHVKAHQTGSNYLVVYNNFADNLASRRLKR